jgi:hypothetical protein
VTIAIKIGYSDYVPANWWSRGQRGVDHNGVVHMHDRCNARGCVVNDIVGLSVPVKVGGGD